MIKKIKSFVGFCLKKVVELLNHLIYLIEEKRGN